MVREPATGEEPLRLIGNRRGFTLIEVLIVVSILGVMMTLAVPAVERSLTTNRLDRATMVITRDLQYAFSLAGRQRAPVTVHILDNPPRLVVRDGPTNAQMFTRHYSRAASPASVTGWVANVTSFQIQPNGVALSDLDLLVSHGPHQRRLTMSRLGRIRVTVP